MLLVRPGSHVSKYFYDTHERYYDRSTDTSALDADSPSDGARVCANRFRTNERAEYTTRAGINNNEARWKQNKAESLAARQN